MYTLYIDQQLWSNLDLLNFTLTNDFKRFGIVDFWLRIYIQWSLKKFWALFYVQIVVFNACLATILMHVDIGAKETILETPKAWWQLSRIADECYKLQTILYNALLTVDHWLSTKLHPCTLTLLWLQQYSKCVLYNNCIC